MKFLLEIVFSRPLSLPNIRSFLTWNTIQGVPNACTYFFLPRFKVKSPEQNNVIAWKGDYYLIWRFFISANE